MPADSQQQSQCSMFTSQRTQHPTVHVWFCGSVSYSQTQCCRSCPCDRTCLSLMHICILCRCWPQSSTVQGKTDACCADVPGMRVRVTLVRQCIPITNAGLLLVPGRAPGQKGSATGLQEEAGPSAGRQRQRPLKVLPHKAQQTRLYTYP